MVFLEASFEMVLDKNVEKINKWNITDSLPATRLCGSSFDKKKAHLKIIARAVFWCTYSNVS